MRYLRLSFHYLLITTLFLSPLSAYDHNNRDSWQRPEQILDSIGVKKGMIIGEAGAGEGYFTFKLSQRVEEVGKIYANDIVKKKLKKIQDRCKDEGVQNITTILGKVKDPLFPKNALDMVIMVYVFHHLEEPVAFLRNTKPSLKPAAPLVIVERDPDKFGGRDGHFLPKEKVIAALNEADYVIEKILTFLLRDNIYICYPK